MGVPGMASVAGILLTGGASHRMGADKANLVLDGENVTLAARTAGLLRAVAGPCVEVGLGCSGLPALREDPPGDGPLAALAAGAGWLRDRQWAGSALVVATDLPHLDAATLDWLAGHPGAGSVVPVVAGYPQPLCARWSGADLTMARSLVAAGRRAMRNLVAAASPLRADPAADGGPGAAGLADADTPEQARAYGLRRQGTGVRR